MTDRTIQLGSETITIPEDCPNTDKFRERFFSFLKLYFLTADHGGEALAEWRRIRIVPEPFSTDPIATNYYQQACLVLNPKARAWVRFEACLFDQFLPFDEEGDDQVPAIPGWDPKGFDLAA